MRTYLLLVAIFATVALVSGCGSLIPTSSSPTPTLVATAPTTPSPTPQGTLSNTPPPTATPVATSTPEPTLPLFITNNDCQSISTEQLPTTPVTITDSVGLTLIVEVEIADQPSERQQGLMCRNFIAPGTGMIFLFSSPSMSGFWMFNTYVPIHIIYVDPSNGMAGMAHMTPCIRGPQENDGQWRNRCVAEAGNYRPNNDYLAAIELPEGWLESVGFNLAGQITVIWPEQTL